MNYGSPCAGQGHETVAAQVVADELHVPIDRIRIQQIFDSQTSPWTSRSGLYSDKFCNLDLGAIIDAARELKEKLLSLASKSLKLPSTDLTLSDGFVISRSSEVSKISFGELATANGGKIVAEGYYEVFDSRELDDQGTACKTHLTFANGAHAALVEVDLETGSVRVLKYVAVQDCGTVLNPVIAEGQIHGATLHGIAASLLEEYSYDDEGHLLNSTYNDYLAQTAKDAPSVEVILKSTPSPFTALGAKGIGDVAAILPPATISSAVEDALSHLRIAVDELPIKPDRLHKCIRSAMLAKPNSQTLG